jgi:hypothetical protein
MTITPAPTSSLTVEYGFAVKHRSAAVSSPLPIADALTGKKWHATFREATAAARRSAGPYSPSTVIIQRWVSAAQEVSAE